MTKELLLAKLKEMNVYDLERLRECFEYEFKINEPNREYIKDILEHIRLAMDDKAKEM